MAFSTIVIIELCNRIPQKPKFQIHSIRNTFMVCGLSCLISNAEQTSFHRQNKIYYIQVKIGFEYIQHCIEGVFFVLSIKAKKHTGDDKLQQLFTDDVDDGITLLVSHLWTAALLSSLFYIQKHTPLWTQTFFPLGAGRASMNLVSPWVAQSTRD